MVCYPSQRVKCKFMITQYFFFFWCIKVPKDCMSSSTHGRNSKHNAFNKYVNLDNSSFSWLKTLSLTRTMASIIFLVMLLETVSEVVRSTVELYQDDIRQLCDYRLVRCSLIIKSTHFLELCSPSYAAHTSTMMLLIRVPWCCSYKYHDAAHTSTIMLTLAKLIQSAFLKFPRHSWSKSEDV